MRVQYITLLAFLVLGASAWTGTSQIDWEMQQMLNNRAAVHPGSGLIAGDGFQTYQYNSTLVLMSYFDSSYGYFNYSAKIPTRKVFGLGFSHSSFSQLEMKDATPVKNFTNWQTGGIKAFNPHAANNWYWPVSGVIINEKLHLLVQQAYLHNSGEWGNGTHMMTIENPIDHPDAWTVTHFTDISSNGFLVDGNDNFVYKMSSLKGVRILQRWAKSDVVAGNYANLECYVNSTGKLGWSNNCNLVPAHLYEFGTIAVDAGNVIYHSWLQQWVSVTSNDCAIILWTAPEITGPWTKTTARWTIPAKYNPKTYCYQPNLHPAFVSSSKPDEIFATINTYNFSDNSDIDPDTSGFDKLWMTIPIAVRFQLSKTGIHVI